MSMVIIQILPQSLPPPLPPPFSPPPPPPLPLPPLPLPPLQSEALQEGRGVEGEGRGRARRRGRRRRGRGGGRGGRSERIVELFYKHTLLWAEPGKEREITTNKWTKMCLKYGRISAWLAYTPRAYKKTICRSNSWSLIRMINVDSPKGTKGTGLTPRTPVKYRKEGKKDREMSSGEEKREIKWNNL